jgi:hypothetical protein
VSNYLITVSATTNRGRTKLHTFGKLVEAEHLDWFAETHASRKQVQQRRIPGCALPSPWPPPPRRRLGTALYDQLGDGTIHLADGVDLSAATLTVILNALRSDDRHEIDVDDLKTVLSQLGSLISQLRELDDEQRRLAEPALFAEILRRCAKL